MDYAANFAVVADNQLYIQLVEGVTPEEGRDAVAATAADIPTAVVQTSQEQVDAISDQVNDLLGVVTGLLEMTVLVALVGVTNTMALAVFERTREIGVLCAVGLSRPQTRRMIRFEASIVSAFGALLGVVLGIFFGWAIIRALADEGFDSFVIPWVALAGWVLATAVLGPVRDLAGDTRGQAQRADCHLVRVSTSENGKRPAPHHRALRVRAAAVRSRIFTSFHTE